MTKNVGLGQTGQQIDRATDRPGNRSLDHIGELLHVSREAVVSYESRVANVVGTVSQEIELFNYTTGQYETVDRRLSSPTDSVVSVIPGGRSCPVCGSRNRCNASSYQIREFISVLGVQHAKLVPAVHGSCRSSFLDNNAIVADRSAIIAL